MVATFKEIKTFGALLLISCAIHFFLLSQVIAHNVRTPSNLQSNRFDIELVARQSLMPEPSETVVERPKKPEKKPNIPAQVKTEIAPDLSALEELKTFLKDEEITSDNNDPTNMPRLDYGAKQNAVVKKQSNDSSNGRALVAAKSNVPAPALLGDSGKAKNDSFDGQFSDDGNGNDEKNSLSDGVNEIGVESLANLPEQPDINIPPALVGNLGNVAFQEKDLGNVLIQDPEAEKQAKELKLVNLHLKNLFAQVEAKWVDPYKNKPPKKRIHSPQGVIVVNLKQGGHLKNASVYRSSGYNSLDDSWLDAVNAVSRFKLSDNPRVAATYLRFYVLFAAHEERKELMPFEKERYTQIN
jgi:hypothetical protein